MKPDDENFTHMIYLFIFIIFIMNLCGCGKEMPMHFNPKYKYPMGAKVDLEMDEVPQDPLNPIPYKKSSPFLF
jgi:hypothetical protein